MDPNGKVAIVTGAGSGIGRATAVALAAAGASVVVADMNEDGGRETVSQIEGAGGKASFNRVDVRDRAALDAMVDFAEKTYGGLDIIHNNAGVGTPRPIFPAARIEDWERTLFIDLWAVIAGTQAAVPAMQRRGGGVVVNTASIAGLMAICLTRSTPPPSTASSASRARSATSRRSPTSASTASARASSTRRWCAWPTAT